MLLLNLLGILAIGSSSLEVAVAIDDLDDTLKQALFLVKLLKSDFAQNLRSNDDIMAISTEDENTTCSLPSEEFNSTMPMNETEVTVSLATPSTPATPPPSTPDGPPATPNVMPAGAPMMMPYASWPPMAMGYPPSGPGRQNFPDENYRFPYRLSRRRMMPDYYYFDSPAKSRGKFRRLDNDPTNDLGNTPDSAQPGPKSLGAGNFGQEFLIITKVSTKEGFDVIRDTSLPPSSDADSPKLSTSQPQTTSSLSSATSEATTLHMEKTTASTTSLSTTLAQPSTSIPPATELAILRTTIFANHTILTTADSAKQSIPTDPSKQTVVPTIAKSILLTAISTKHTSLPRIILSTRRTEHRKRVGLRKRLPVSKATTTVILNRKVNHLNVSRHRLRQRTHTTTTKKIIEDNFEMAQVALELNKELEGTYAEDVHASHKDSNNQKLKKHEKATTTTKTTTTRTTTTMKVFLQGSSRMPIPFPENNGFCHYHPENALCGAI